MTSRILLIDVDREDEPLEALIEQRRPLVLRLKVANTAVVFEMSRTDREKPFTGSLGGRSFTFDPRAATEPDKNVPSCNPKRTSTCARQSNTSDQTAGIRVEKFKSASDLL
jgi:hypothetical protein